MASESDIRINAEGVWFYRGTAMTRSDIIVLFYRNLRQDDAGRYFIEIGRQRYPVSVEDTAFVVWNLDWRGSGHEAETPVYLHLSDNTLEKLDPETLRIGKDHIPYCRVKNGRFAARFSRAGYYKLVERLEHDPANDQYFITVNARRYHLG